VREIKFRAWDKKLKEMEDNPVSDIEGWTVNDQLEDLRDKKILMQYTGLKDKNDKEIYEGDLVRYQYDKNLNWEVYYNDGAFWLRSGDRIVGDANAIDDAETAIHWEECEVIGNIHENPELGVKVGSM